MISIDVITCLPEILDGPLNESIVKRAQEKKLIEINIHNLRDYSTDKHKKVDDYSFGGGGGMILQIEPIYKCCLLYTSPSPRDLYRSRMPSSA